MVSSKQFFPTEKHKYEKVVLPPSYLLKNATRPGVTRLTRSIFNQAMLVSHS